MRALELKIPPGVLGVAIWSAMWAAAKLRPSLEIRLPGLVWIAAGLALAGGVVVAMAIVELRRADTTLNPTRPDSSARLVTSGIYRWTRNPMYLGVLLFLCSWALVLANSLALLGLPVFFAYLTRYQIQPEERALAERFGAEFVAYQSRVRRWL